MGCSADHPTGQSVYPTGWKTARSVVIPKTGQTKLPTHRAIALLGSLGKLVEMVAAYLIADQL